MAGPRACHSFCWNFSPAGKDKLAGAAPIKGSDTPTSTFVMLRVPTPAPATAPAVTPSLDNELFKQFMKAYLEVQVPGQTKVDSKPCKQPCKVRFPDFYYVNLHMDCYWFCQQCEDHFKTIKAKRPNKILVAALFLRKLVTQQ